MMLHNRGETKAEREGNDNQDTDDDKIIHILREHGCEIDKNIEKLEQFSMAQKVQYTVHCIETILKDKDVDLPMSYSASLPKERLAEYLREIGFNGTIEDKTFSNTNVSEMRKIFDFLIRHLPINRTDSGIKAFREKTNMKTSILVMILCTSILTIMDIIMIVLVCTSKSDIKGFMVTVKNVQKAFNKLGMQLTTSIGDEDAALLPLIVIESVAIVLAVVQMIFLFLMKKYLNWRKTIFAFSAPFIIIGIKELILMVVLSVFVNKMRPSESSELNKTTLLKSLHDGYKDDSFPSPGNADSDTWNEIFIDFQCCAVNAVKTTTNDFDLTPWCTTSGSCQQTNSQIPKACCKGVDKTTYSSAPSNCHEFVSIGYYHEQDCFMVWSTVVNNLEEEKKIIYGYGIAVAVLHAISFILPFLFAVCFLKRKEENKRRISDIKDEVNISKEAPSRIL